MPVGWMKKVEDSRTGKIRHYLPSLAGDSNLRPEELPLHSINSRRNFLATCGRRKELKKKKNNKTKSTLPDLVMERQHSVSTAVISSSPFTDSAGFLLQIPCSCELCCAEPMSKCWWFSCPLYWIGSELSPNPIAWPFVSKSQNYSPRIKMVCYFQVSGNDFWEARNSWVHWWQCSPCLSTICSRFDIQTY